MRAVQSSDTPPTPNSQSQIKKQRIRSFKNLSEVKNSEEVSYGPAVQTSKNTVDLRGMRVEEASHHLKLAINTTGAEQTFDSQSVPDLYVQVFPQASHFHYLSILNN
ncbi:hypothetical protein L1987_18250 [Smallanthus sonchifolius]|uniref:Uncharacterized protein n=1 Tax=Smallanthus sonchifolius TaxID=185202 RepID=A0ACB9IZT3_9ASTR|nr:hypothetical protein L1987_18250 [Smallanthus sonchifolius]